MGYAKQESSRPEVATLLPAKQAAALILQKSDASRRVSMTSGRSHIMNNDGAQQIAGMLRDHPGIDAVDAIYQEVARLMHNKRPGTLQR